MTVYAKPSVRPAWAETATAPNITDPGTPFQTLGWPQTLTPPQRQYFNWLLNRLDAGMRYFMQRGLVDYDAAETYQTGAMVIAANGLVYASLVNANINHEPSVSTTQWGSIGTKTPTTGDNTTKIATTQFVFSNAAARANNLSDLASPSTARANLGLAAVAASGSAADLTGLLANARLSLGNVSQFQGSLVIAGGNVTGFVANATHATSATSATSAVTAGSANGADQATSSTWLDTTQPQTAGAAPAYAARAWVTFQAGGAILGQGNVSSVTHFSAGRWAVNFTKNMPNINYAVAPGVTRVPGNSGAMVFIDDLGSPPSVSSCPIAHVNQGGLLIDANRVSVTFFA